MKLCWELDYPLKIVAAAQLLEYNLWLRRVYANKQALQSSPHWDVIM